MYSVRSSNANALNDAIFHALICLLSTPFKMRIENLERSLKKKAQKINTHFKQSQIK